MAVVFSTKASRDQYLDAWFQLAPARYNIWFDNVGGDSRAMIDGLRNSSPKLFLRVLRKARLNIL